MHQVTPPCSPLHQFIPQQPSNSNPFTSQPLYQDPYKLSVVSQHLLPSKASSIHGLIIVPPHFLGLVNLIHLMWVLPTITQSLIDGTALLLKILSPCLALPSLLARWSKTSSCVLSHCGRWLLCAMILLNHPLTYRNIIIFVAEAPQ